MDLTYVSIGMGLKVSRLKITLKMETVGFVTSRCERNRKNQARLTQKYACMRDKSTTGVGAVTGRGRQWRMDFEARETPFQGLYMGSQGHVSQLQR